MAITDSRFSEAHPEMLFVILHEGIEIGLQLFVRSEHPDFEVAPVLS